MTTTEDPRGDAVASLHRDLASARSIPNEAVKAAMHQRIQAAATIELVEAVRDLSALVALTISSTAPGYLDAPIARVSDAEAAGGADAPKATVLGSIAYELDVGDTVELERGVALTVTAAGVDQGSTWYELSDHDGTRRFFADYLATDERVVIAHEKGDGYPEPEPGEVEAIAAEDTVKLPIVAQHETVDADDDDLDDVVPVGPLVLTTDEEGDEDDFDVTV